ncbi:hypothetical protein LGL94_10120 [Yersinia ruckeri]|uniref:hypothetical protein n=1 Tax=Yersinia ruckeri TaxID=29486 RepID=UPI001F253A21|nr:hypothetical protein [Yersinia ruckeri]UIN09473.1 hypothetical protein LGL94_10120 [Yersinia ruckeri]
MAKIKGFSHLFGRGAKASEENEEDKDKDKDKEKSKKAKGRHAEEDEDQDDNEDEEKNGKKPRGVALKAMMTIRMKKTLMQKTTAMTPMRMRGKTMTAMMKTKTAMLKRVVGLSVSAVQGFLAANMQRVAWI